MILEEICKEEEMTRNFYEGLIIKSILNSHALDLGAEPKVEVILTLQSYHHRLNEVVTILETGVYTKLGELIDHPKTSDDLTLIKFKDVKEQEFYGIVYDSDELWQDPVVTRVFPIVSKCT